MRLSQGSTHLFALLLLGKPAHSRLEEEDAKDAEKDEEFEQDEPYQGLPPGHIAESVPIQGGKECNQPAHTYKSTNSLLQNQHLAREMEVIDYPIDTQILLRVLRRRICVKC